VNRNFWKSAKVAPDKEFVFWEKTPKLVRRRGTAFCSVSFDRFEFVFNTQLHLQHFTAKLSAEIASN